MKLSHTFWYVYIFRPNLIFCSEFIKKKKEFIIWLKKRQPSQHRAILVCRGIAWHIVVSTED